jgi:hypothetical protein
MTMFASIPDDWRAELGDARTDTSLAELETFVTGERTAVPEHPPVAAIVCPPGGRAPCLRRQRSVPIVERGAGETRPPTDLLGPGSRAGARTGAKRSCYLALTLEAPILSRAFAATSSPDLLFQSIFR